MVWNPGKMGIFMGELLVYQRVTVRPWKWMTGRRSFPFEIGTFQGLLLLLVSGRVVLWFLGAMKKNTLQKISKQQGLIWLPKSPIEKEKSYLSSKSKIDYFQFTQIFPGWWLNQPLWKICSSNLESSPNRDENKKCLKPPPSLRLFPIHPDFFFAA